MTRLVLASASPRRAELLQQIGVEFDVKSVDLDETPKVGETPDDYVSRLALAKAQFCLDQLSNEAIVLGSDTTVVVDGAILGKPESQDHARKMLQALSGRSHRVMTSIAVVTAEQQRVLTVITHVQFKSLSDEEIARYWQTGEPQDKAGGYGIQGLGAVFVKEIQGSYSAVVGLPLMETAMLLEEVGINVWQVS